MIHATRRRRSPSAETMRKANEILQLAYDSGRFADALNARSPSRLIAEAEEVLGPEFSDVDVKVTTRAPYVQAHRGAR